MLSLPVPRALDGFIARRHQPQRPPLATDCGPVAAAAAVVVVVPVCLFASTYSNQAHAHILVHIHVSLPLPPSPPPTALPTPPQSDDSSSTCTPAPRTSGWHGTILFAAHLPRQHPIVALIVTCPITYLLTYLLTTQTHSLQPPVSSAHSKPALVLQASATCSLIVSGRTSPLATAPPVTYLS